jgi:hypothetical protein
LQEKHNVAINRISNREAETSLEIPSLYGGFANHLSVHTTRTKEGWSWKSGALWKECEEGQEWCVSVGAAAQRLAESRQGRSSIVRGRPGTVTMEFGNILIYGNGTMYFLFFLHIFFYFLFSRSSNKKKEYKKEFFGTK